MTYIINPKLYTQPLPFPPASSCPLPNCASRDELHEGTRVWGSIPDPMQVKHKKLRYIYTGRGGVGVQKVVQAI